MGDPVAVGLVENLAYPGGNLTGLANVVPEGFVGKQLEFLKAVVPQASRIAVLINPTNQTNQRDRARLSEIGRLLGVELVVVEASKPDQLEQGLWLNEAISDNAGRAAPRHANSAALEVHQQGLSRGTKSRSRCES